MKPDGQDKLMAIELLATAHILQEQVAEYLHSKEKNLDEVVVL